MFIYHITARKTWEQAQAAGFYSADSLAAEGFIHASTREQVAESGNRYYHGQTGLVLLVIDAGRLQPELRFDPVQRGGVSMSFPHIYGPLNTSAVVEVLDFPPDEQGNFHF
jgi:uncharacterized protein (DUF952 family)